MYELYNEPHASSLDSYTSGMIAMAQAVRKHTENPMVVAGAYGYAYDADSLVSLKALAPFKDDQNLIWNFHPY